jgi:uncharacterized membrane protein YphA (DoxX/SURF4 family)
MRLDVFAQLFLFLLRVAVGWHFAYEGWVKWQKMRTAEGIDRVAAEAESAAATKTPAPTEPTADGSAKAKTEPTEPAKVDEKKDEGEARGRPPSSRGWSARGYLNDARGPLAEYFWNLAEEGATLDFPGLEGEPVFPLLDRVVVFSQMGLGAALILGLFTRTACLGVIGMLALFYITQPPWDLRPLPPQTHDLRRKTVTLEDGGELRLDASGGKTRVELYELGKVEPKVRIEADDRAGVRRQALELNRYDVYVLYRRHAHWLRSPPPDPSRARENFLFVNYNLIELLAAGLLLCANAGFACGFDVLVRHYVTGYIVGGRRGEEVPSDELQEPAGEEPAAPPPTPRPASVFRQAPSYTEAPTVTAPPMTMDPTLPRTAMQMPAGSLDATPGLPLSPPPGLVRLQFTCNVCLRPFQADVDGFGRPTTVRCPGCGRQDLYSARPDEQLK